MGCLAPDGPVYQAGTLSGNPLAMAAGVAVLEALSDGSVYKKIEALGQALSPIRLFSLVVCYHAAAAWTSTSRYQLSRCRAS